MLQRIQAVFEDRQLYVLFEPTLNCNPITDHTTTKNVYPVYDKPLRLLLDAFLVKARAKIVEIFNNELETYNKLISDNNDQVKDAMLAI